MKTHKAVVLLSGGIDSSTVLAIATNRDGYECHALWFDYGQRHRVEEEAAHDVADLIGVHSFHIAKINVPFESSSLTNPEIDVSKDGIKKGIPKTYVPARNIIFLSYGLGLATDIEAESVYIGANAIDYSGYPDCRPEFIKAFGEVARVGLPKPIGIVAPIINMKKSDIIKSGKAFGLDFSLTWSCYDPYVIEGRFGNDAIHCGKCDSCRIRKEGFKQSGIDDPTHYHDLLSEISTEIFT